MQSSADKLLNAIDTSTERWRRQGFQRRFSVTDLHGVEYRSTMDKDIPAQFYTSVSFDFDRFAHWWFKIIIRPSAVRRTITPGSGISPDGSVGFSGNGDYSGGTISYGGVTLGTDTIKSIVKYSKQFGVLPSGIISQMYLESNWGNSNVGRQDNNWSGIKYTSPERPSGVKVTQGTGSPEGDYYARYTSVDDYLKDHFYLIATQVAGNNQKMYNVQGKRTFGEYVIGLFIEGGASYNYAHIGYSHYKSAMDNVRSGINQANNNVLDSIDNGLLTTETNSSSAPVAPAVTPVKVATAEKTLQAVARIDGLMGTRIGSGQCYGLVAYYSQLLGGVGLGGGVTNITHLIGRGVSASDIGTDYGWVSVGWSVKSPASAEDFKVGAILNFKANDPNTGTGPHGHTGVIKAIQGDNLIMLEQNVNDRQYVTEEVRPIAMMLNSTSTLVYPPELVEGLATSNVSGSVNYGVTVPFPEDIRVTIDGIDFTPMFKTQFGGAWIEDYAIYPNDKANEGYDVMMAAGALTPEQQAVVYTSGEHLVEISGSIKADVILRTYLKYNHLN